MKEMGREESQWLCAIFLLGMQGFKWQTEEEAYC
jgi:hypothetical protein